MKPIVYKPEELAALLKVSPAKIRKSCKTGEIHAHKIGREWRISEREARRLWPDVFESAGA